MTSLLEYYLSDEREFYIVVAQLWTAVAVFAHVAMVCFPQLSKFGTDWGRHRKADAVLSNQISWFIMEIPSLALTLYYYVTVRIINVLVTIGNKRIELDYSTFHDHVGWALHSQSYHISLST